MSERKTEKQKLRIAERSESSVPSHILLIRLVQSLIDNQMLLMSAQLLNLKLCQYFVYNFKTLLFIRRIYNIHPLTL